MMPPGDLDSQNGLMWQRPSHCSEDTSNHASPQTWASTISGFLKFVNSKH